MKTTSWIVELQNPKNVEETIWTFSGETLEKVSNEWLNQTGNTFINYHKLHNIYHKRNKGDGILVKVKKIKQDASSYISSSSSDSD
tara:strand:- start:785 stop:1042 length:258 start_codon:yes stop_codon:yes gene_type:complete